MIPGLSEAGEARLLSLLDPRITAITADMWEALNFLLLSPGDADLARLGVHCTGDPGLAVVVTDPLRPVGRLTVHAASPGCLVYLDNRRAASGLVGNIRMLGADTAVILNDLDAGYVALAEIFLRSPGQLVFWGSGATAVGCSMEIEGEGRMVAIGDDALISSGVWIRNFDMHAIHDLRSGERINRPPVDTVLERHVWLGQDAMLLNTQRVGAGTIVGAKSLVKGVVGPCVAVGGVPARVIRFQVSWGRDAAGMSAQETALLRSLVPI